MAKTNSIFEILMDDLFGLSHFDFSYCVDKTKPDYDVIENDKAYIIEVLLPGIKKDDIEIKTEDEILSIKAERKEDEKIKYKLKKSFTGTQKLIFKLLKDIDTENIGAEMNDGILTITLLKITDPEKLGKKTIKIK